MEKDSVDSTYLVLLKLVIVKEMCQENVKVVGRPWEGMLGISYITNEKGYE